MPATLPLCSVLMLAGGRGQRMGGRDKGLIDWQGRPLIAHVHAVVRGLSDDLIVSCNRNRQVYQRYAEHCVSDAEAGFPGPLAGVLAGLAVARHGWVVVLACDAPRVDQALINDLRRAAMAANSAAMVRQGGYWQPMFSVLPRAILPLLEQAWDAGERSLQRALVGAPVAAVDCAEADCRLNNFNSPQWLEG
ncbi:molybdenum cofactor guanylyltransferase MobA [Pseudomonas putida]|uniref:molybdenum cofactor guanylyltransferase MobA n=1 Tax=Pseudomonas putida TaxID=303 RepID=UPI0035710CCF